MRANIIAELGVNWLGDWKLAEEMIAAAAGAGVDYVKTQTWKESKLRSDGPWNSDDPVWVEERIIYRHAQLDSKEKHLRMMEMCEKYNVKYLTTLFCAEDFEILPDMSEIKIAGIEADNFDLMRTCANNFEHIFVSVCGLSDTAINRTAGYFQGRGTDFTLMHGVYLYPCPLHSSRMFRIHDFKRFHNKIGYSDHTQGPEASYYALANGCAAVERHFTTNNAFVGVDNKFSCLPSEMKSVCDFRDAVVDMERHEPVDEGFILKSFKGRWAGEK